MIRHTYDYGRDGLAVDFHVRRSWTFRHIVRQTCRHAQARTATEQKQRS